MREKEIQVNDVELTVIISVPDGEMGYEAARSSLRASNAFRRQVEERVQSLLEDALDEADEPFFLAHDVTSSGSIATAYRRIP